MKFGRGGTGAKSASDPRRDRRRRRRRRLLKIALALLAIVVLAPALFIATRCTGSRTPTAAANPAPVPMPTRDESQSFLTLPEWSIVYSAEEYAQHVTRAAPSAFPYFSSALQFWSYADATCQVTRREYPFNFGYQVMIGVIGTSFSIELALKGLYENTIGRITEWISSSGTEEDRFAARIAAEYGAFMHTVPWYAFPFAKKLGALWRETPMWGPHPIRKWERRVALSAEYGVKAIYGWVIGKATAGAYEPEALEIHAWIDHAPETIFKDARVHLVNTVGPESYIVRLPRYEAFTEVALALAAQNVRFVNIAGNDEILVTAIASRELTEPLGGGTIIARVPILSQPPAHRLALRVPVTYLSELLAWLPAHGVTLEHIYDY
jgi:hypothetical protein